MSTIDLNNLSGIPIEFIAKLKNFDSFFMENKFLDNILPDSSIASLIERINKYCLKNQIIGYHYTRAFPNEIQNNGLSCRQGNEIRALFIQNFGKLFTEEEIITIKNIWKNFYNKQQQDIRDNRLFFNFTTIGLKNFGGEPLLNHFGGEQVSMPLKDLSEICNKIKNIGSPLILKCTLDPNKIITYFDNPWGRIAISSYHCKINPEAHQDDQDGFQYQNVNPENIEIIEYKKDKEYQ